VPAAWEFFASVPNILEPDVNLKVSAAPGRVLAVLVPHTGEVSSEWCLRFKEIQMPPGSQVFMSRGMPIDVTRESMVDAALKQGFEWIFFLDSDVILPDKALEKLFSHKQPLINGMYKAKKPGGFFWAVWMRIKSPEGKEAFAPISTWTGRLIQCDVIGTGCMLVHRSVFEKIREKFPGIPLFLWTKDRNPKLLDKLDLPDPLMREVSEDFFFCLLAKLSGFPMIVDTEIKCGHISVIKVDESTVTLPSV
jgi:hypothetical protein